MKNSEYLFRKLNITINKLVNEPARLKILTILYVVENAEFNYLLDKLELTKGNLSSHISKLENANYVSVHKSFVNKIPRTIIGITPTGRMEYEEYRENIIDILRMVEI